MTSSNYELPKQRISVSKKLDKAWYKPVCDYWIDIAERCKDVKFTQNCIDAANGIVPSEVFDYVMKPLSGDQNDASFNLPVDIRNTDFITPIREKYLGEYLEIPYKFHVKPYNVEAVLERDANIKDELIKLIDQAVVNNLNEKGFPTGQPSKEIPDLEDPQKLVQSKVKEWMDKEAIKAKNVLELLNAETNFDTLRQKAYYYWWATEEFYTYRYIHNGKLYKEVIYPTECYPILNGEEFVEDQDGMLRRHTVTFNKFLDTYKSKFEDRDLETIEKLITRDQAGKSVTLYARDLQYLNAGISSYRAPVGTSYFTSQDRMVTINHLVFKTEVEVNILTSVNELGNVVESVVEEDYALVALSK